MNVHSSAITNEGDMDLERARQAKFPEKANYDDNVIDLEKQLEPERQKIFYNSCHVGMNATERGEVKIRVSRWCGGRLVKLNSSSGQGSSSIDCVADQDSSEDKVNRPWTDKKHFNSR